MKLLGKKIRIHLENWSNEQRGSFFQAKLDLGLFYCCPIGGKWADRRSSFGCNCILVAINEQEGRTKTLPVVRSLEKNLMKKLALEVIQRMKSESLSAFYDENADIFCLLLIG